MKYVIFDCETTISNNGNPFDLTNSLVNFGVYSPDTNTYRIHYGVDNEIVREINGLFRQTDVVVVGTNLKFDLNWWRRIGGEYPRRVWDLQIAEFLFSNQEHKYPSLDELLEKYNHPLKLDVVKTEYWENGIDTDKIPRDILTAYLKGDLEKTYQVFKDQYYDFQSGKYKRLYPLFKLQCMDLITLADMEYNGVFFNTEKALAYADEIQKRQDEITNNISEYTGNIPFVLTSDAHLSALLYGGVILDEFRIPVGVYKSGARQGQTRYNIAYKTYELPKLIEPLKGSQVKEKVSNKEREFVEKGILKEPRTQYSVNEDTLKQLKPSKKGKELLSLILEFNKLDKLRSTYLIGWSKLIETMNWEHNIIHSTFNQAFVVTGRLSSSKPNGQNADKMTKKFCESRYE